MMKSLGIRTKIAILSTLAFFALAVLLSMTALRDLKNVKIADESRQLAAVNMAKYEEITRVLHNFKALITAMADSPETAAVLRIFDKEFHEIARDTDINLEKVKAALKKDYETDFLARVHYDVPQAARKRPLEDYLPKSADALVAQYLFIAKNPAPVGRKNDFVYNPRFPSGYMRAHKKFHPRFDDYRKAFDLYDIFIVDAEGDVVYTAFKERDFATNLFYGPFADTGLAKVFKKTLKLGPKQIAFEDFSPYEPSYNRYASFIATPIFQEGKRLGALVFQLPIEQINDIMKFGGHYRRVGLGKTGDCFLVGEDYKMRSDSRFRKSIDDPLVRKLHSTIGVYTVRNDSTEAIFEKGEEEGSRIIRNDRGKEILSAYHALDVFSQARWAVVSQIAMSEVLAPMQTLKKNFLLVGTSLFLFVILIYISVVNRLVVVPLEKFTTGLKNFFEFLNGKRSDIRPLAVQADDEIGKMVRFVNEGIALSKETLKRKEDDLWVKSGIHLLNGALAEAVSTRQVCEKSIAAMCDYLEADYGLLYICEEGCETLRLCGACGKIDEVKTRYRCGEGLIGQVAETKLPLRRRSGSEKLCDTNVLPLLFQNGIYGVVKIGGIGHCEDKERRFLQEACKVAAVSLAAALQNEKVQRLFEKSRTAHERLQQEHGKLEEANALMKEQYEALEEAKKELERTSRYKSEFLANMSHELRTPLNAIILLSQLLAKNRKRNLNGDDVKKAETIFKSGHDLLRMINEILDLSKVEAGKMQILVDRFDSEEFLREMKRLFEDEAAQKGLRFEAVDLYRGEIVSDKNRIAQIVKNLLSNALKFTEEGYVALKISKNEGAELPIVIRVEDSGVGIEKHKREKIFEAFVQADGSTSRKYGGTGLGLSISKELAKLLGGTLRVEPNEGGGSVFILELPHLVEKEKIEDADTPASIEECKKEDSSKSSTTASGENEPIRKRRLDLGGSRVLIVQEHVKKLFLLDSLLRKYGARTLHAYGVNEAIDLLEKGPKPDLVLMGWPMRETDLYEAVSYIKKRLRFHAVVMVADEISPEARQKASEAGVDDFFLESVEGERFAAALERWLGKT